MRCLTIIPVNGIGNRLRAIAACLYLSRKLGREATIVWEPESQLPGRWNDIFEPSPALQFSSMVNAQELDLVPYEPVPLYKSHDADFVMLRGNDRGEQRFAKQYFRMLKNSPNKSGVVMAGDYFHHRAGSLEQAGKFLVKERTSLANLLTFTPSIRDSAERLAPTAPYLSLHLRGTDRVGDAASPTDLVAAAVTMAKKRGVTNVFVGSDDNRLIDMAEPLLRSSGLKMTVNPDPRKRQTLSDTRAAFVDYLVLRGGIAFVGSNRSTFSTEIGVNYPRRQKVLL